jgi:L-arabinose isomerase
MKALADREVWFVTGSQHLYGAETLRLVEEHARLIARELEASAAIPVRVIAKPVVTTPESIHEVCLAATAAQSCVGVIAWMHTFSPAKMWIAGLTVLQKPLLHLTPSSTAISPGQRSTWTS